MTYNAAGGVVQFAEILRSLVRDPRWSTGTLAEARALLTEASARALDVGRVSVWRSAGDGSGIHCDDLFITATVEHRPGPFLPAEACPAYFAAIEDARVLAVADAQSDPRTAALAPDYLEPRGIGALLDAPIVVDGHLWGVVCHEHLGGPRPWSQAERTFAASIGDLMAMVLLAERRRLAELTLRRREKQVRVALQAANMADWSWDMRTDRVHWSPGVAQIFGLEPGETPDGVAGFMELVHPEDLAHVEQTMAAAMSDGDDYYVRHRVLPTGGGVRWLEGRGAVERDERGQPTHIIGIVADITARHALEQRLARSARLESLGRLAGGIAHDFNNLLAAIGGAAELLDMQIDDPSTARLFQTISNSVDRAANLTGQLLAFGRRRAALPSPLDLSAVVRETGQLLAHLLGEDIQLIIDEPGPVWVLAASAQLEQVIVNLSVNARDAMPNGGTLRLTVRHGRPEDDGMASLHVSDTGSGISKDVLDHMFEPFYTTKPMGQGTGLGLAICHGIITELDGSIEVESEVGIGTTFRVTLPPTEQRPAEPEAEPEPTDSPAFLTGLHVALVEDDPDVAHLLVRSLEEDGHTVSLAGSGPAGIALVQGLGRVDLLICDVVLPGLSGPDVVRAARSEKPGLPVLLITGYAPGGIPDDLAGVPVLTKPFRRGDLRRAIVEVVET